ncbi:MAG: hypothetical protein R2710_08040, partial [Acidimicrobiales bacterium]
MSNHPTSGRLIATILTLALAAAACGSSGNGQSSATTSTAPTTTSAADPTESSETTTTTAAPGGDTTVDDTTGEALPSTIWGIETTTFDLVEVATDTGEVVTRVLGWGAAAADPDQEGGAQRLVEVEAVGDALWVSDCCEPAVGSLYRVDPNDPAAVPDAVVRTNGTFPAGSPDGSMLAVQIAGIGVAVVDAATGDPVVDPAAIGNVLPSPDGTQPPIFPRPLGWLDAQTLVVSSDDEGRSTISFISLTSPASPALVGAVIDIDAEVIDGAMRGDGAIVVALDEGGSPVARVFDPDTGNEVAVFELPAETTAIDYDHDGTYLVASGEGMPTTWLGRGEVVEVGTELIGAAWSEPGTAPPSTTGLVLTAITRDALDTTGLEGVGCWFRRGGDEADDVFFGGDSDTLAIIDGEPIVGQIEG